MVNKYFENLDDEMAMNFSKLKFRSMYVEQILGAQTMLFNDMRQAAGLQNSNLLRLFVWTRTVPVVLTTKLE